jgi:hypothetical protein
MRVERIAHSTIRGAKGIVNTMYYRANTEDIISVIMHADKQAAVYTTQFAAALKEKHGGNIKALLYDVWRFLRHYVSYKADDGHQKIKSPAQLIKDGVGDCKSYSVFIGSVLRNLSISYVYRYADYDQDNDVNHVYIVAYPPGSAPIIVDAVHTVFGEEAPGANYIFDIDPQTGNRREAKISGVSGPHVSSPNRGLIIGAAAASAAIITLLISNVKNYAAY